jgi:hypothetical protein
VYQARQAPRVLPAHKASVALLVRRASPDRWVRQAHAENRVLQDRWVPEESLAFVEKRVPQDLLARKVSAGPQAQAARPSGLLHLSGD